MRHVLILAAFLLLWTAALALFSVPDYLVPSPYQLVEKTWFLVTRAGLLWHIPVTVVEIIAGYAIGVLVGIAAALATAGWFAWRRQTWRRPLLFSLLAGAFVWSGISAAVVLNTSTTGVPAAAPADTDDAERRACKAISRSGGAMDGCSSRPTSTL